MNFFRTCWTIAIPMLALILISTVLFFGHRQAATLVSNLGTMAVLLANLVYIVFWHSKKRWPNTSAPERLKRVLLFRR